MTDVAVLGLEVRSDTVKKGTEDLDKLTNAAARAQAAATGLASSTKNAGAVAKAANNNWETYEETAARVGVKNRGAAAAAKVAAAATTQQAAAVDNLDRGSQRAARSVGMFGAALGAIGTAVGGFIMYALATAVGVLIAELGKLVDWSGIASSALIMLADVIVIIAPYAVGVAAALALIYAPAILSGVAALVSVVWSLVTALGAAAIAFAAANPAVAFVLGIAAAVAAANIFRDELAQIFGRDVVGDAKRAVNFIIGAFVGGYNAVVEAWNNLPTFFSAIGKSAWNNLVSEFEKPALTVNGMTIIPGLNLTGMKSTLSGAEDRAMKGATATFNEAAMNTDYVGGGLEIIERGASTAADAIRGLASGLGTVDTGLKATDKAAKEGANGWREYGRAAQRAIESTINFAQDLGRGFISDLRYGLDEGRGLWGSFADAALNALDMISSKLLDMATDQLISNLLGSLLGGGFLSPRAWGAIQAGGGGLYAKGGVFDQSGVTAFAKGGVVNTPTVFPFAKGVGLMGEAGPEAIMPLKRGPDGSLGVRAAANQNDGAAVNFAPVYNIDARGADAAAVERLERGLQKTNAEMNSRVVQAVREANKRNVKFA